MAPVRRSRSSRPELPDPATMSLEELRAEVEGGRDAFEVAFEVVVEENESLEKRLRQLEGDQARSQQDRAFYAEICRATNAATATHGAIIRWLRGPVALRVGKEDADWLANRCAARDWLTK